MHLGLFLLQTIVFARSLRYAPRRNQSAASPEKAPSTLAVSGRYILSPLVFKELDKQKTGVSGEIQLTDAIAATLNTVPMHGIRYEGRRFDCGNKIGFLMANIEFALDRPDIADEFRAAIKTLNI